MVPIFVLAAVTGLGLLVAAVLAVRAAAALARLRAQIARTQSEVEPAYRAYRARTRSADPCAHTGSGVRSEGARRR
ncbi:hypothetical protein [Nocardiopsis coralliicola]